MATELWAPPTVDLPDGVVAGLAAARGDVSSASPLALLVAGADADPRWAEHLEAQGLAAGDELEPWLVDALSVLLWPDVLVRLRDTVLHAPATYFMAGDLLVFYAHADGVCTIGRPVAHDGAIDELVGAVTTRDARSGDPEVLELSRHALQAIDLVLAAEPTRAGALGALSALSSSPDAPAEILEALVADRVVTCDAADHVAPGPAVAGWEPVLHAAHRLEVQRMDLDAGPDEAVVRTMLFLGPPGARALLLPEKDGTVLLARPTRDEAETLLDAFVSPSPGDDEDPLARARARWRADADTLIEEAS